MHSPLGICHPPCHSTHSQKRSSYATVEASSLANSAANSLTLGARPGSSLFSRSSTFIELQNKLGQICCTSPSLIEIKFQLPNEPLDSRLVSVETDEDVEVMMSEFKAGQRIPIYAFDTTTSRDKACPSVSKAAFGGPNLTHGIGGEILQTSVGSQTSPATSELVNVGETQALVVGQQFPDAQAFRDAFVATAIAMKFELTFIRSDRARVTAICAAGGCSWRIHASKLPDVDTFQIKTLRGEHLCVRPERSSHKHEMGLELYHGSCSGKY